MLFDHSVVSADWIRDTLTAALASAEETVNRIVAPETSLTFDEILLPLEDISDALTTVSGRTAFMGYVHPDKTVRTAGKEAEERLAKWGVELAFRRDLYEKVRAFADSDQASRLEGERARLLEFTLRDFRRAGHELDASERDRLKELTNRLVELGVRFEQHIAEHQDHLELGADDLEGLPDHFVETLEPGDVEGTYKVTMAYPHVFPFMENSPRRDLREALYLKFQTIAAEENRPILEEAVRIRKKIAGLFGKASWAEHQLEDRMAKHPDAVDRFYGDLRGPLTEAAVAERDRMSKLLEADTGDAELQVYDRAYYENLLRKTEYGVDQQKIAEYFPLQQVLDGMFEMTGRVFGLRYEPVESLAWHPDVSTHAIYDAASDELIAHFYMDLFPREGKFNHAAAFTLVGGRELPDDSYQHPVSAIVANLTKPTASRPSLLQHQEVLTLFHEFGHILHQTLTRAEFPRFSGTNTEQDFVEAPSQIMEHWTWKADVLSRFARHHDTGAPIPEELVDQLVAAKNLNVALFNLRQMSFGVMDLALHGPADEKDLDEILLEGSAVGLLPHQEGTFMLGSFGHMFGYDAAYYGYLWSVVYGDDMFSRFEEQGYLDPEVGMQYRTTVLEQGGSVDGMDMLRAFLGREPNNAAFLRNLGISA
jgi:thimet oligopeptidase